LLLYAKAGAMPDHILNLIPWYVRPIVCGKPTLADIFGAKISGSFGTALPYFGGLAGV
jgi:hypothetical protein